MSHAVSELTSSNPTTTSIGQAGDYANASQGNALQIRGDCYAPSSPSSIPSNAEIRALKAEVVGSTLAARGEPQNPMRFQGGWNSQAMLAQFQAITPLRASSDEVLLPEVGDNSLADEQETAFNTELWYAQTGVNLARQKSEQLSFKKIVTRNSWISDG